MDNLAVLQESLKRSDTMTKNMLSILDSFENRLGKLEETIIPIYQETGNLQRRHESIFYLSCYLLRCLNFICIMIGFCLQCSDTVGLVSERKNIWSVRILLWR